MTDSFIQREQERTWDDEQDRRRVAAERRDRELEKAPIDVCRTCGQPSVEVRPSHWECGCSRWFSLGWPA